MKKNMPNDSINDLSRRSSLISAGLLATMLGCTVIMSACRINIDHDNQRELKGSGNRISENRAVSAFSSVKNDSPFDVEITPSAEKKVDITGDDNLVHEIETVVENNRLLIRLKNTESVHFSWDQSPVVIHIQAMDLNTIDNSGSGSTAIYQLHAEQIHLISSGAGDISASGSINQVKIDNDGSGDFNLADLQIKNLVIDNHGSGDTELGQVNQSLHIKGDGSGNIKADHVQLNDLVVEINGSGDVDLQGSSSALLATLSGSGNLRINQLMAEKSELIIHGSGHAELIGDIQQFNLQLYGSGELNGEHLNVGQIDVMASGSGDVMLHSVRTRANAELSGSGEFQSEFDKATELKFAINGPGSATLKGRANNLDARLTGSGDLHATELILDHASVKVTGSSYAEVNVKSVDKTKTGTASSNSSRIVKIDRSGIVENN